MIKLLDKHVADKIAAGEVVDRPLSIVKELVENAVDAGADSIVVEIKNGGKTYIRVTDNGCGIPEGEVSLAFTRHATSKIFTDKDLETIETLGFRGEALASIASVSRVEMVTKTEDEKTGTRIRIEGSEVLVNGKTGAPSGTTVVVTDLFYNTPARLKFMKSDQAESVQIIDFMSKMALAYAGLKLRLISNGNILFSTQGKGDIYSSILTVYSSEIGDKLIRIHAERDYLSLDGYISHAGYSKTSKKMQVFFVNGRSVSSKVIDQGVTDAYADKLFSGRFPVVFLFLRSMPEKLDVNIHPNKKEVRFDDERFVSAFVTDAIRESLAVKEAIPEIKKENAFKMPPKAEFAAPQREQVDIKQLLSTIRQEEEVNQERQVDFLKEEKISYTAAPEKKAFDMRSLHVNGSIFATYITALDDDSLYLIDQHAAHERIFFERLMAQYHSEEKHQQTILVPFVINVSYAVKAGAFDWLDSLNQAGFEVEEFGPKAFLVKAIPMFMELSEAEAFIAYFLDNISERADLTDIAKVEKIISASCKSAVKANDALTMEEIHQLISDLSNCENPYSCPHGRPTFIKLTKYEIEKMFKRV